MYASGRKLEMQGRLAVDFALSSSAQTMLEYLFSSTKRENTMVW